MPYDIIKGVKLWKVPLPHVLYSIAELLLTINVLLFIVKIRIPFLLGLCGGGGNKLKLLNERSRWSSIGSNSVIYECSFIC